MPACSAAAPQLPHNVASFSTVRRTWNGVSVDINHWRGKGAVTHRFPHETQARLVALLHESGSACEPRLRESQPCPVGYTPQHMDFAPADMEMWGYSADAREVKDATLSFDLPALGKRLSTRFDRNRLATPRLRFADDRLHGLVRMLGDAVDDPDPAAQLYGDGLTAAIAALLFTGPVEAKAGVKRLAPWQVHQAIDHLEAHLPNPVNLADLAGLANLSQSHFSKAFKATTGMAPYRWQLDARVRRAQALLLETKFSLSAIAEATGFADAVHFGRTFRKHVGTTPSAWRRDRKS